MNDAVIMPAQSGSVAKQLCNAQFDGIAPVKDRLLALMVVAGAVLLGWLVHRERRTTKDRASRQDGSGGADAGGEGGGHGTSHGWFGGHGHSGDHGGGVDSGGSDGGGGDGGGSGAD